MQSISWLFTGIQKKVLTIKKISGVIFVGLLCFCATNFSAWAHQDFPLNEKLLHRNQAWVGIRHSFPAAYFRLASVVSYPIAIWAPIWSLLYEMLFHMSCLLSLSNLDLVLIYLSTCPISHSTCAGWFPHKRRYVAYFPHFQSGRPPSWLLYSLAEYYYCRNFIILSLDASKRQGLHSHEFGPGRL